MRSSGNRPDCVGRFSSWRKARDIRTWPGFPAKPAYRPALRQSSSRVGSQSFRPRRQRTPIWQPLRLSRRGRRGDISAPRSKRPQATRFGKSRRASSSALGAREPSGRSGRCVRTSGRSTPRPDREARFSRVAAMADPGGGAAGSRRRRRTPRRRVASRSSDGSDRFGGRSRSRRSRRR